MRLGIGYLFSILRIYVPRGCVKIHHRLHGLTQNELNLLIIKDAYLCKSV